MFSEARTDSGSDLHLNNVLGDRCIYTFGDKENEDTVLSLMRNYCVGGSDGVLLLVYLSKWTQNKFHLLGNDKDAAVEMLCNSVLVL